MEYQNRSGAYSCEFFTNLSWRPWRKDETDLSDEDEEDDDALEQEEGMDGAQGRKRVKPTNKQREFRFQPLLQVASDDPPILPSSHGFQDERFHWESILICEANAFNAATLKRIRAKFLQEGQIKAKTEKTEWRGLSDFQVLGFLLTSVGVLKPPYRMFMGYCYPTDWKDVVRMRAKLTERGIAFDPRKKFRVTSWIEYTVRKELGAMRTQDEVFKPYSLKEAKRFWASGALEKMEYDERIGKFCMKNQSSLLRLVALLCVEYNRPPSEEIYAAFGFHMPKPYEAYPTLSSEEQKRKKREIKGILYDALKSKGEVPDEWFL